ncbi:hypothetical protein BUY37_10090 [Staphylococcus cohnii]|uniref:hypothetical protein n=1 Tax=Staphylococcus TaxID=1279 RepID=UPI000D1BC7C3|nr:MULTISPECIES: hypothetical protein [Staphylococcus]PTF17255.1 hypothetical protein BUY40_12750 [Staphylococcus cohnii]PTF25357.1 hypothetical protein BUY30_03310 [Staphylococcus cohnii]PTF31438.1 hypothetical protein BUY21_12220 [Staphylococcus cohnii]PTG42057.1 hypothetical protein BUY20_11925 [Staphylococcus cohnii]RIL74293.1 hypothetical protein BUY37_10090 [Staphylococcus cohnii]
MLIGIVYTNFAIFGGFWMAMFMAGGFTVRMKSIESLNDFRLSLLIGVLSLFVLILSSQLMNYLNILEPPLIYIYFLIKE